MEPHILIGDFERIDILELGTFRIYSKNAFQYQILNTNNNQPIL